MRLAECIRETAVESGEVAIYYLGQAGFCLKTRANTLVYLDPYFSDYCQRAYGFKRMLPSLLTPEELGPHIAASTHAHADHLDPDALPLLAQHPSTLFVGAPDCAQVYQEAGLPPERYAILAEGESLRVRDVELRATYADHGDLAPDAVGFLLTADGTTIYDVGDTGYAPERIVSSLNTSVDVMIAPINGQFGNLDARQACELAKAVQPRVLIASHFWMFIEHGGDPGAFLAAATELPGNVTAVVMAPGEELIYSRSLGIRQCRAFDSLGGACGSP